MSRIRTNVITNRMANGAPTVSNGLVISGVTTTSDVNVGQGVTFTQTGNATFTGIVTALSFRGDGSQLSNVTSTTINNNANNRIITGSGTANTLEGESTFTFDGNTLSVSGSGSHPFSIGGGDYRNLAISGNSASSSGFIYLGNGAAATNADFDLGRIRIYNGATQVVQISGTTDTSANDDGRISFHTKATGGSLSEKLRITSGGYVQTKSELWVGGSAPVLRWRDTTHGEKATARISGSDLYFEVNNTERLRITSAGDVLIPGNQATSSETGKLDIYHTADGDINNPHIRLWGTTNADPRIEFGSPTNSGEGGYIMYNDSDEALYIGSRMATYSEVNICTGMNDGDPATNIRHRVNASGQVTKPSQPSFAAYRNANEYSLNGDDFTFNATLHNIGSHFNTSNYRFTAPVAGRYLFTFYSILNTQINNGVYSIRVNGGGSNGQYVHFTTTNNSWDHVSTSWILNLSANDYVTMRSDSNIGWHGNAWQRFCGELLS